MSELPAGWAEMRLGDLARAEYGKGLRAADRDASGSIPVYGSAGPAGFHTESLVDDPVVIVGRKGNAGACFVVTTPCWPIDTTYFVRIPDGVVPQLIGYQLSRLGLGLLDSSTAIPSLRRPDLESARISLPPLNEQRRIVAAIEEHLSRLDAADASLAAALRRLAGLRRLALIDGFNGSWPAVELREATDPARPICYGILKPKTTGTLEVPYVEVRSIKNGRVDVDSLHRTTRALHEEFKRSELRGGDVVLAIRGSFDRAAVVPGQLEGANVSRDVARIAPLSQLDPEYLAHYLGGPAAFRYFAAAARGVGVRGVNIGDLRTMRIPLPPLDEQRRIVAEVEERLSRIDAMRASIERAQRRSQTLRAAILERAFRGELVPQDPADEPAETLLARIRAAGRLSRPKV